MKKMILEQRGFTLIELMIVVAIIGILAAIAIPKFTSMLEKSREGATKGNLGAIRSAIAIYYGDREGVWPTTINHMNVGELFDVVVFRFTTACCGYLFHRQCARSGWK